MALYVAGALLPASFLPGTNVLTPPIGSVITFGASQTLFFTGNGATQICNEGGAMTGPGDYFREVNVGTSGLFGKCVQATGRGAAFRGTVLAELQIELATTGGTGAVTECVFVQSYDGFRFFAAASDVEEVSA